MKRNDGVMQGKENTIEVMSEWVCCKLHPREMRSTYVEHIRVEYWADEIILLMQWLSKGLTTIFYGLIASYLYDRFGKAETNGIESINELLGAHRKALAQLSILIEKEGDERVREKAIELASLHEVLLKRIVENDPDLYRLIDIAKRELDDLGSAELNSRLESEFWREGKDN